MATIHKRKLNSGEIVWQLTHGTGKDRVRMVAGRTRDEAQEVLKQFERQLALHGGAPSDDSVAAVIGQYEAYLKTNRRERTVARYMRVITTFHECFLTPHFPDVQRLRQLRPMHLEEYKRMRHEGVIAHVPSENDVRRGQALRLQVTGPRKGRTPQDRAKFGWLGHRGISAKVSSRTINYELRALFTFFNWAVKRLGGHPNPAIDRHFKTGH